MSQPPAAAVLTYFPAESAFARRTKYLRELWASRSLIGFLTRSSMQAEKVTLWFGFLWWCLDPLLRMLVYTLIIDVIFQKGVANFPLFVMAALLPWEFFTKATRNSMADMRSKTERMRQVAFPRAVIPLSATLAELTRVVVALGLYLVVGIGFGVYPNSPVLLLALPLLVLLLAITLGFGYFLSALNLFVPDTEQAVGHVFRLWMFLSPVLYSIQSVPARFRILFKLNPFAEILDAFRSVLFYHQVPAGGPLAIAVAGSVLILVFGFAFFVVKERAFAKLV